MGEEDTVVNAADAHDESSEAEATEQKTASADDGEDTSHEESDTADKGDAPSQKEEEPTEEEDDDAEPPTRKPRTPADWVALRRQRKLEREQKKAQESKGEDEGAEDEEVSPEDAKIIDARVQKHLAPILQERAEAQLRSEINDFIAQNPEFKQYAAKAEKWAKHPSWENVPTEQLMYAVAGKELLKIGANRRAAAEAKARKSTVSGGSPQGTAQTKAVWEMTPDEFSKEVERVKLGQ
jgi:hypothetical protein